MSARVVIERDALDLEAAHKLSGRKHESGEQLEPSGKWSHSSRSLERKVAILKLCVTAKQNN